MHAALVGSGIDEELEGNLILERNRDHRRQVAACAIATNRDARRIDLERCCIFNYVIRNGEAVIDSSRKRTFRPQAIIDREHCAARADCELPAKDVVRVEIADGPAAAMKENQRRQHTFGHRPVGT